MLRYIKQDNNLEIKTPSLDPNRERVYRYKIDGQSYFIILAPKDIAEFEDRYGVSLEFWRECDEED